MRNRNGSQLDPLKMLSLDDYLRRVASEKTRQFSESANLIQDISLDFFLGIKDAIYCCGASFANENRCSLMNNAAKLFTATVFDSLSLLFFFHALAPIFANTHDYDGDVILSVSEEITALKFDRCIRISHHPNFVIFGCWWLKCS